MKLTPLFLCICLTVITLPQLALAECKLLACNKKTFSLISYAWVEADPSGNQCWYCGIDKNYCNKGDIVTYTDSNNNIIGLYQCNWSLGGATAPKFINFEPGRFCDDSDLKHNDSKKIKYDTETSLKTYKMIGKQTSNTSLSDWKVFTAETACIHIKCNEDYIPNLDKTECIQDTRKTDCEKTSGDWDDKNEKCTCNDNEHLTSTNDNLKCKCAKDYVEEKTEPKLICKPSEALQQKEKNKENQDKCKKSGGKWNEKNECDCTADHTTTDKIECKCESEEYVWKNSNNKKEGCKIKDAVDIKNRNEKCNQSKKSGQPVEWDENKKECICQGDNNQYETINDNGEIYYCTETEDYKKCKELNSEARWYDGKCICNDKTKDYQKGKCELSQETKKADAKTKIEELGKTLDKTTGTLERSKWRDADGNFNTARLASDSVAAIVLGTTGGLISSKVIKKKQVENGFEDLKCTIGNQEVANWGDEFQVGIQ